MDSEYWATGYRLAQAREAADRGEYQEAADYLGQITNEMRASEFWPYILTLTVIIEMMTGVPVSGARTLEARIRAAARAPVYTNGEVELDWLRAVVHLIHGHHEKAEALLAVYRKPPAPVILTMGMIALSRSNPERALAVLSKMPDTAGPRLDAHAFMARAAAHIRLGQHETARDNVGAAVAVMRGSGLAMQAVLLPRDDLAAVTVLLQGFEPGFETKAGLVRAATTGPSLTRRERVVLRAIAEHGSTPVIAAELNVSPNTVKSQTRSIYKKLGVSTRAEALKQAQSRGLLD